MNTTNKNIQDKIQILKALQGDINENKAIDVAKGYRKTQKKITGRSSRQRVLSLFSRVAAILVIPLLLSTLFLTYKYINGMFSNHLDITYTEIIASPGSIIKTQLPDLSEVWLNSGSTLRYPSRFSNERREVTLIGEAFFDVKTNPEQPFVVGLPADIEVIATGTAFNINAYPDESKYETSLQHGLVEIKRGDESIKLSPNEMVTFDKGINYMAKSTINIEEKTGWKKGLLIFRNTPLDEVFRRLSRKYNIDFEIHTETDIDYGIRATFTTETITQILDVLKMAAPITWSVREMEQQNDLTYSRQHIDIWIK